jgi:recombination protein RecA
MKAIPSESYKERVETMNLNRHETKSAIIGMVIGDGCLSRHKGRKGNKVGNAFYQMSHSKKQHEYMLWKKNILDKISKCTIWENDKKTPSKTYKMYRLYSRANPVYTKLYNRFYQYGKKSVDEYLLKMITPLALAIIYMDDGCVSTYESKKTGAPSETFYLSLNNFDYANLFLIKKCFKLKFDLDWNINKTSYQFYCLRLPHRQNQKFVDIVFPYIEQVPCMLYKLGSYVGPQSNEVDIVRPT